MDHANPLIIEEFYQNPEAIRKLAISLPYVQLPTFESLYQSDCSLVSSHTVRALSDLVGRPVQYDGDRRTFGVFRLAMKSDSDQTNVHCDLHDWSGVVHLSPPSHGKGSGTGFFRHRATGLIGPPPGEPAESELMSQFFKDGKVADAWEIYDFVESKFNRMVIFRGRDYFHDTIGRFGARLEDARLTQNFFFFSLRRLVDPGKLTDLQETTGRGRVRSLLALRRLNPFSLGMAQPGRTPG